MVYENGVLVISGQAADRTANGVPIIRWKSILASSPSAVALPGPVDLDNSQAEYKNGFLVVRLPKAKRMDVKIEE